ncbi:HMA2 domain-containing protein [Priestia aryabhattai]|uniref:HMA2 domain-containing protein n=1 Tax=Priestia aryabhattai TaxID=412384 RepID=UPI00203B3C3A|nr:metal ABC transporter ATPase [Priestia aryabhattai]MCM3769019.1 metal ABC transporter ATPase [Priestia aryabhattai]
MKYVERKLHKLQINLVHFIPGRIRLRSTVWKENKRLVELIISNLKSQVLVYDALFTPDTGSLLITYNASHMTNNKEIEEWFQLIEQIYQEEYRS